MIKIYHYNDNTSDKIWAINMKPLADGEYEVFYGRRTNTLTKRIINVSDPYKKIDEKTEKGYCSVGGIIHVEPVHGLRYREAKLPDETESITPTSIPKPKKRPNKIVNLSRIKTDNHSAFF